MGLLQLICINSFDHTNHFTHPLSSCLAFALSQTSKVLQIWIDFTPPDGRETNVSNQLNI